jgi:beta-lactamase regulating signal transducer with metallopeptidase domain/type II secretory pathway component GspD/PulD (secretin)
MAALENILSPQIVQKLGWTLLHFVWQAGVVALLLAILLRALRKSTPNIRYIVACAAMALIILMPTITFNLLSAPQPASPVESIPISARVSAAPQEPYGADMLLGRAAQYMQTPRYTSWQERADQVCAAVLPYLVAGWLVGVFGLSIWHLGGWAQLHRLKSRMVEDVNLFVHSTLQQLSGKLGVNKVVQVVKSALVEVPTVVGWIRPVVLLPASALTGLSSQQLEALLAHELAHIRRHDYLVNMLQTAVEILGFYHPAVWWISHTIRLERENCCDDMAISVCGDARQYVKALAEMERIRCGQAELAIAASGGNLSRRISRLLGKEAGVKTHASWAPAVIAAILLIALAIPASLALSGADSEDTSAAAISNLAAGTTTDEMLPPAPGSAEIAGKLQIALECKVIEVPADSEFVKGKNPGDVIIRLDGEFSSRLEALIRATQGAHVLTAPKAIMLDGEEAMIAIGEDRPCITGYEPGAGGDKKPKPIIEYVFCGLELKIKANVVDSDAVHMDIDLTTRSKPAEQKDASGRTIHVTARSDCTSEMTVKDAETIIISGPKDEDRPNQTLILQITPRIIRPDERIGIPAKADIKDRLAAAEPTKAAEYPVTMAIKAADYAKAANAKPGQNPLGMAIRVVLDSIDQLTAAGTQIDDLREVRKILSAKGFTIDAANFSGDKCALLISKLIDDGIKGRLACRLTKQNDRLLIERIDFESAGPARREPARLRPLSSQAEETMPTPAGPPEADQQDSAGSIIQIFKLRYADCEQAATILSTLLTSDRKVMIVPEPRSNQLIVQAAASDFQQIERLLAEIDVPGGRTPAETIGLNIEPNSADAASQEHRIISTEKLRVLEEERKALAEKLQTQRQTIRQLAQEYGTADLTKHQDMKLQRVATLLDTRTKTEARRMQLETELKLLEQTGEQTATPQALLKMRQDYTNNDPTIKALAEKVAQVEMELLLARQTSAESSPEITNKTRLLQGLKKRLDELKNEVGRSFDELMAEETAKGKQQKLARLQAELQQLGEYERRLSNLLNQEDSEIVKLGRKQLDIQDLQRQMDLDQQMYDTVSRRLKEMQQNRPIGQVETPTAPDTTPRPEPVTREDQEK